MTHPNVLKAGKINPDIYTGWAFGFGIERVIMMKYKLEDIRNYYTGNNVPDTCYQINGNLYKPEYLNIIFYFIPLCLGNSACSSIIKIFFRPCLDWRELR